MKQSPKLFCLTACALLAASTVQAEVVTYEFDSNSTVVTTNELAGLSVTADNAATAGGDGVSYADNRWQRTLSPEAAKTVSFTINIGATAIDLTGLSFTHGIDSPTGDNDTFSVVDLTITTTGSETPGASDTNFTNSHGGTDAVSAPFEVNVNESESLSGLTNLTNVSVTFEFSVLYGTLPAGTGGANNARFATIDNVQITGSEAVVVPTPAALPAGLAMLGLAAMRRRRIK